MHAAARPSQAAQASCNRRMGRWRRRHRDRGRHASRHQPFSPRRSRGRHRAVCFARLSAGLRTRGLGARNEWGGTRNEWEATAAALLVSRSLFLQLVPRLFLARRFPRPVPQCNDGFVSTYRCGAVPDSNRLPFSSSGASQWNRRPQHNVVGWIRQRYIWNKSGDCRLDFKCPARPFGFHASGL